ncbi:hypothetical protein [Labrys wisconsinensis]|uniref:DUF551 domain-containing protein n=1 Tax=Labrys wisconsinensis TaxID=425677 RepID=A0ABU0IYT0_9HYPH|nr:hypothetical protein [Labrys wisconsinensis]MDQ0467169.1 hypothetical protein [Labrys wisconsinensis]
MTKPVFGQWQRMGSVPRDGTRVLALIRKSEQGPDEVDVVRWARDATAGDERWISTDGDSECVILYAEAELAFWMPLPSPVTDRQTPYAAADLPAPPQREEEAGGSGI